MAMHRNAIAICAYSTRRPGAAEEATRAPHRLYGFLDASERGSAARWRELALAEIAASHQAGRLPILVGGTGLYLRALVNGLAPVPDIPPEIRAETLTLYARLGPDKFRAELARFDPIAAARFPPRPQPHAAHPRLRGRAVDGPTDRGVAGRNRGAGAVPLRDDPARAAP